MFWSFFILTELKWKGFCAALGCCSFITHGRNLIFNLQIFSLKTENIRFLKLLLYLKCYLNSCCESIFTLKCIELRIRRLLQHILLKTIYHAQVNWFQPNIEQEFTGHYVLHRKMHRMLEMSV